MRHLSPADIIDVIEGTAAQAAVSHAGQCARCRDAVAGLRATLQVAADVDVPEPSPLFWEHFSSRVHDAIAEEPASGAAPGVGRPRWSGWAAGRLAIAGVLAVLLMAVVIGTRSHWDRGSDAPVPATMASAGETGSAAAGPAIVAGRSATADDASLDLVADLSGNLDWDQTADAGMMVKVGSVDSAVMQLSATERVELARLLEAQLRHTSS